MDEKEVPPNMAGEAGTSTSNLTLHLRERHGSPTQDLSRVPRRLPAKKHSHRSAWVTYRAPCFTVSLQRVGQAACSAFCW
ncbi:hypothetical protein E2C01_013830 [Portunus trituberculatus]|uniref:Uncharacterized protein n=1 Tax=Portunus trituberculatus TaxID=210409 RepID=A0A5B7DHM4_PORTR|nr:hypothetical protein [Portunus trituberculatus]